MDEAAPLSSLDGFLYDFVKLNKKVAFCNIYERAVGNPCFRWTCGMIFLSLATRKSTMLWHKWAPFLEQNQDEGFPSHIMSCHISDHPKQELWLSGGGWEEQPWQYGFPKVKWKPSQIFKTCLAWTTVTHPCLIFHLEWKNCHLYFRPTIHQLRSVKSPAEVKLMRKSCQVSITAPR